MQPRRPAARRALVPLALAALASGCDGCPSSRPYTPFTIDSGAPAGSAAAPPPGASAAAPAQSGAVPATTFAPLEGRPPPEDGKRWPLEGGAIVEAPPGRTFEAGLVLDADGDGVRDLVAWARAPDALRGELLFAPGAKPEAARTLAALPGDLSARGCNPRVRLTQIGPSTIALDFAPQCGARKRDAIRWIAVLRVTRSTAGDPVAPELVLELRLRVPPPDEVLSVELDAADRDSDGRGDLTVSLGFSGSVRPFPPGPELRAPIVFFDRPAGLSRNPSQPGEALRALAADLLIDARRKATAPAVAAAARRLRRLHALLCGDAGGSPVVATGGGPLPCGEAALAASIAYAEAVAALTQGQPLAALAALEAAGGRRDKDAAKLLAKAAPPAAAAVLHRVAAAPQPARGGLGPLAFEPSGDVLVLTGDGVVRVDHDTFVEAPADAPPWPTPITAAGAELVGIERRCDAPALIALIRATPDAVGPMDVPIPVLAPPSGDRCAGAARVPFAPLGASDGRFDLAIGAALLSIDARAAAPAASAASLPLATTAAPGAARSPDGATLALPAAGGLLVAGSGGARLWSGEGLTEASACAPANGGTRVACLVGGAAALYEIKK